MGSKPTVITPPPPTVYQSVIPLQSYQQLGDYFKRIKEQTNVEQANLYAQSGTPEEIGARQAAVRLKEASSYLASLPGGDDSASQDIYSQAQKDYSSALSRAQQGTAPAYTQKEIEELPSWATSTIPEGLPKPPMPDEMSKKPTTAKDKVAAFLSNFSNS
jgi:hypothetical protein